MSDVKYLIDDVEAEAIRSYRGGVAGTVDMGVRVFLPVERTVAPTGRAACRLCGVLIPKGEPCVSFMFDPKSTGTPASWGRLGRAYIHIECQPNEGGSR